MFFIKIQKKNLTKTRNSQMTTLTYICLTKCTLTTIAHCFVLCKLHRTHLRIIEALIFFPLPYISEKHMYVENYIHAIVLRRCTKTTFNKQQGDSAPHLLFEKYFLVNSEHMSEMIFDIKYQELPSSEGTAFYWTTITFTEKIKIFCLFFTYGMGFFLIFDNTVYCTILHLVKYYVCFFLMSFATVPYFLLVER